MLQVGDKAPDVLGYDQEGRELRLSDYAGRKLVLYFYPKDATPGCTAEACSFRDHYERYQKAGYEVLGVSADAAASHKRFIERQSLPFNLIADTDRKLIERFGVWGEKMLYGKKYMGLLRTTFIINEAGVIIRRIEAKEINTRRHAEDILPEQ